MKFAALVFFVAATFTVIFVGVGIYNAAHEWQKVAENINQTFEEYKPKDDVNIF
jgi:hypothetical protein